MLLYQGSFLDIYTKMFYQFPVEDYRVFNIFIMCYLQYFTFIARWSLVSWSTAKTVTCVDFTLPIPTVNGTLVVTMFTIKASFATTLNFPTIWKTMFIFLKLPLYFHILNRSAFYGIWNKIWLLILGPLKTQQKFHLPQFIVSEFRLITRINNISSTFVRVYDITFANRTIYPYSSKGIPLTFCISQKQR